MADNVAVTAGAGTTIAADEVVDGTLGTVKVQYVKLMDGTLDGTTKAAVGANGLAADVKAVPADPFGANADAAVTAGATGSISAKLRSISRDIVANIVLAAGTAIIGKVGIDQTTPGTTNGVVINNANFNGQATMSASAPVVIASNQTAIPTTQGVTATANGATASRINAAASTNATSLKASAGQLYTIDVFNAAAYNVFLKLYNKASAPTVGTDTPVMTIPVQAGGGYSKTWPAGFPFATGIAYAITKLQADSDTTVVVAGDLTGNTLWI